MVSVEDNVKNIMSKFMKMQDKQQRTGTLWKVGEIGQTLDFGLNKYRVLYELGKGAQGKVFCVERVATRQHFAMKVCKPSSSALSEIKIQRSCYCPNIVTIIESQKINNKVYMILELGQTNLEKYLESKKDRGLEQQELFQLISNIVGGLAVIHRNNFIHHDLKLSNIILNMDIFKIADFGISTQGDFQPMLGTPTYFAPQVLKMPTQTKTPASAVDIWALGVLVFEACFDMHPFLARSFSDMHNLKSQISILCQNGYSFAAYKELLRKDGNMRKLMKFQEKQKRLTNRDILQYFFNRAFTFQPVNRLTLQEIYLMLQQARPVNQNMNVNLFLSHAATGSATDRSFTQNSIPAFNNSFSFQPQSSIVSLNSIPSVVVPLQLTNSINTNYDKIAVIQFLQKTLQILKLTFKDHLSQLVIANQSITSLIQQQQGFSSFDQSIKLIILGIYQRMNTLIPSMPGVFTRLIISAHLYQILRNFMKFMTQIKPISKSTINGLSFKQLDDFSASIDYSSFLYFLQIVKSLI